MLQDTVDSDSTRTCDSSVTLHQKEILKISLKIWIFLSCLLLQIIYLFICL